MLSNLFLLGNRTYLNNAVVISDALDHINTLFGDVRNFKIRFKKPFLSQGDFQLSTERLDGHVVGNFDFKGYTFYFSYTATDVVLTDRINQDHITRFDLSYFITDKCRGIVENHFEKVYGPMSSVDKVIFAIFEMPDTGVFSSILKNGDFPSINISDSEFLGDRRFKLSVYYGTQLLGYRYSTVKEFNV